MPELLRQRDASIPGRSAMFLITVGSYFITLKYVNDKLYDKLVFSKLKSFTTPSPASPKRMRVLLICSAIRTIRQAIWTWKFAVATLPPQFGIMIGFFNWALDIAVMSFAARNPRKWGHWLDYLGIGLFAVGSLIESGYDLMRHNFKQDPKNNGKPYIDGLGKYVVHPNYFGYLAWRTGLACLGGHLILSISPLFLLYDFVYGAIPGLQKHNIKRYGPQYETYLKNTYNLIPGIW